MKPDFKKDYAIPSINVLVLPRWARSKDTWIPNVIPQDSVVTDELVEKVNEWLNTNNNFKFVMESKSFLEKYNFEYVDLNQHMVDVLEKECQEQEELNAAVRDFESALSKAESIADKYSLRFDISPTYGMGGTYEDGSWYPSSESC